MYVLDSRYMYSWERGAKTAIETITDTLLIDAISAFRYRMEIHKVSGNFPGNKLVD